MKLQLLVVGQAKENWFNEVAALYEKKINPLFKIQISHLKIKGLERARSNEKIEKEGDLLVEKLEAGDFVILFDEKGKSFSSLAFAEKLRSVVETNKSVVCLIGGAFGVSDKIKKRANLSISLSSLTFNHLVAQVVVLEQLYRAMTLWRGIPYHNE